LRRRLDRAPPHARALASAIPIALYRFIAVYRPRNAPALLGIGPIVVRVGILGPARGFHFRDRQ